MSSADDQPRALHFGLVEDAVADVSAECLVTLWPDGGVDVAFRSGFNAWGPPVTLTEVPTRMGPER